MSQLVDDDFSATESVFESSDEESTEDNSTTLHWFRRCLRFHDNPALCDAIKLTPCFRCVYITDPPVIDSDSKIENNKWRFLIESLRDLDLTLKRYNSGLYIVEGQPTYVLPFLFKHWNVAVLSIEEDPTPYGARRDRAICSLADHHGVHVIKRCSQTLHPIARLVALCSNHQPLTLQKFHNVFESAGLPEYCTENVPFDKLKISADQSYHEAKYGISTFEEFRFGDCFKSRGVLWPGGESEALRRLQRHLERRMWVATFEGRPKLTADSLLPSPTTLTPYLDFGCLSVRRLYYEMNALYQRIKGLHSIPPVSLHGQLVMREYFYAAANLNENFDKVKGNSMCMPIPWKKPDNVSMKKIVAAETGFPWIDAILKQLTSEGWIHGISKHALISFITYGQLFFSWEDAANLLDRFCLEGDICTNNGIAMLLSGSCYSQLLPSRVESPVLIGKRENIGIELIRRYLPALKSFPDEFIYEPWLAPYDIQVAIGCVIDKQYTGPMLVHHQAVLNSNMSILHQLIQVIKERKVNKRRQKHSARPSPYILPILPSSDNVTTVCNPAM